MLRLALASILFSTASAFLFPMAPSGGGGGGCGCAPPPPPPCCPAPAPSCGCAPPPPPPPPSCGCGCGCGRKKRSAEDVQGVLNMDGPVECNSEELKEVLEKNMQSTPSDSLLSVRNALPSDEFFVMCTHGLTAYSAPPGTKNCAVRQESHFCQVFSIKKTAVELD